MSGVVTASLLPVRPVRRHDEEKLQRDVVQFLRWSLPADAEFFAVPNGGQRHEVVAKKLVPQGVRRGIPDIALVWRGHAYFIELKTPKGGLTAVQRQMHKKLAWCGAQIAVCREVPEVEAWLRGLGMPLRARVTA